MEELQLIRRIQQGDTSAINRLVDNYTDMLFHYSKSFVHEDEVAEEIAFDALFQVIQDLTQGKKHINNITHLTSLLFTIVRNKSIDAYRSQIIRDEVIREYPHIFDTEGYTSDYNEAEAYILDKIYKEIEKLPTKQKDVFKLRWLEGLTPTQIAESKGLSVSTVKNELTTAMKTIRLGFTGNEWTLVLILLAAAGSTAISQLN